MDSLGIQTAAMSVLHRGSSPFTLLNQIVVVGTLSLQDENGTTEPINLPCDYWGGGYQLPGSVALAYVLNGTIGQSTRFNVVIAITPI